MEYDLEKILQAEKEIDKKTRDIIEQGTLRISDLIAPDAIENEPEYTKIGREYKRTIAIVGYPRESYMGWLNSLYSYPGNIDISQHISPVPTDRAIKMLYRKASQFLSTKYADSRKGRLTDPSIDISLQDAQELQTSLQRNEEKLYYQWIYINISGRSEEELDRVTQEVEKLCGGMDLITKEAMFQQDLGFISTLPIGENRLQNMGGKRNFDTSSLSTCMPFTSAELTRTEGSPILYGINTMNSTLVMFDRFELPNYNSVTFAMSGQGKSYFVKLESKRYLEMGVDVMVIDRDREYKKLSDEVGGQIIEISSTSQKHINPFDISSVEQEENGFNFLTRKILDIYAVVELMIKKEIDPLEKKILLESIEETYEKFGISKETQTLVEDNYEDGEYFSLEGRKKRIPTLLDLENTLRSKEKGIDLANYLTQYTTGILNAFAHETNIDTNSRFTVFDIYGMEKELEEIGMFVCAEFIWNRIKQDKKRKKLIVIDEAWYLMKNASSRDFIERIARTARKFNAGLSIISQQTKNFLENGGESIIGNTSMQILLKQHQNDMEPVVKTFGLSQTEQILLRTSAPGEALIFAGGNHTSVKIISDPDEHRICTTNPNEKTV